MSEWAEADRTIRDAVATPGFRRAVFAGVPRNPVTVKWVRVTLRPVELRGDRAIQFQFFDGRQTSNVNRPPDGLDPALTELIESRYSGIHLASDREEINIRTTRKGRISISRKAAATRETPDLSHNRVKDVPLPEGKPDRLLEVMGIADARGRILGRMRAKFTQINEFLKQLRYALCESSLAELDRPIEIVDCGCGSSYLTLAAHHDLTVNLNRPARILGVDTNDSVIRNSISKAAKLNANQLSFHCQRIRELTAPADLVLALHACNTATDDAIAYAIRSNAAVFLGVPCCHQELNRELRPRGPAEILRPILRHGILKERTADLVTDAFRALALRIMGYSVDVVEFVGTEHTARNLMIRAIRGAPVGEAKFLDEYRAMKEFWGVTPAMNAIVGSA